MNHVREHAAFIINDAETFYLWDLATGEKKLVRYPTGISGTTIEGAQAGLVLVSDSPGDALFVGNPVTNKWIKLPPFTEDFGESEMLWRGIHVRYNKGEMVSYKVYESVRGSLPGKPYMLRARYVKFGSRSWSIEESTDDDGEIEVETTGVKCYYDRSKSELHLIQLEAEIDDDEVEPCLQHCPCSSVEAGDYLDHCDRMFQLFCNGGEVLVEDNIGRVMHAAHGLPEDANAFSFYQSSGCCIFMKCCNDKNKICEEDAGEADCRDDKNKGRDEVGDKKADSLKRKGFRYQDNVKRIKSMNTLVIYSDYDSVKSKIPIPDSIEFTSKKQIAFFLKDLST